jgi:N-acetylglucosaminyl-diphospho-decaprenol L-rhamnosyltransferase
MPRSQLGRSCGSRLAFEGHGYDRLVGSVSVVVVSYNSERYLERCLESVQGHGYEIVVVDNASADGSVDLVRRRFPDVRVVVLERNVGYGAANNVGFEVTQSEYVLVLNPDAWAIGPALDRLVAAAATLPSAAILGPRLIGPDGTHEQSVRGFPTLWRLATEFLFLRWLAPGSRALNAFYGAGTDEAGGTVEWVMGAAMLVRRVAFEKVSGFDPRFFMYSEEVDLAYRLRREGWDVVYFPQATFVHVGGGSTHALPGSRLCEILRSHVRFLDKHHGAAVARRGRLLLLFSMVLRAFVLTGERRRAAAGAARWLARHDVEMLLRSSSNP